MTVMNNKLSVKQWLNDEFIRAEARQLRNDVLMSFKTSDLKKAYGNKCGDAKTKTDIVANLADSVNQFKFNGIFKDDDANFYNQLVRVYLNNK